MEIRPRLEAYAPTTVSIKPSDVYVHTSIKEDLDGIVKNVERADLFGKDVRYSGILFTGSAGTGKTLTAQLLASLTNSYFFDAGKVGTGDQIRNIYDAARKVRDSQKKPVIIFMDEIDRFSKRDSIVDPSQHATLNQLLMQMDGTENNFNIYVIGATNRPEDIEPALRRPKRFGKEVEFMPPDAKGRHEILKIHAYNKDHKFKVPEAEVKRMSEVTYGYTGADLVGLLVEAFTKANLGDRVNVQSADFDHALRKSVPSALRDMPYREPKKGFESIGGYEYHKELIKKVMKSDSGLFLLYGPPGCGKSVFPEAVAKEFGYSFIVIEGSSLVDPFVGETGKKIDRVLTRAKLLAPTVLVFDEFGSLVKQKGWMGYKDTWTGLLQSKLSNPMPGVYIFATENDPDNLTDQIVQRFNYPIFFGLPESGEYERIWRIYAPEGIGLSKIMDISRANKLSPRHIKDICRRVSDYGLPKEERTYAALAERTKNSIDKYDDVRQRIGDRVSEYREMTDFAKELEMHGKVQTT